MADALIGNAQEVFAAVARGEVSALRAALSRGKPSVVLNGVPLIYHAVRFGPRGVLDVVLEAGANVEDCWGRKSAAHAAVLRGTPYPHGVELPCSTQAGPNDGVLGRLAELPWFRALMDKRDHAAAGFEGHDATIREAVLWRLIRTTDPVEELASEGGCAPEGKEAEEETASSEVDGKVLESVLSAAAGIMKTSLSKVARNRYVTARGEALQLARTSPYKDREAEGNFKLRPEHLEADWFLVWKTDGTEGWLIETGEMSEFFSSVPQSARLDGSASWDPRIGVVEGADRIWTNARAHGFLDVTGSRFSVAA